MRRGYNFNLSFQTTMMLFIISFVASNLLGRLTKAAPTESNSQANKAETLKREVADILSTKQYFQDIFSEHLAPFKMEFGHVCENPNEWEQRFERRDFDDNRHSGKVKWGNKRGEYGEQYWDLNH